MTMLHVVPTEKILAVRTCVLDRPNIGVAFLGAGIIWLFTKFWLDAAKMLFWVGATLMALSVAHFTVVLLAGAIAWAMNAPQAREKWIWASTAVRFSELILTLGLVVVGGGAC
jgi:hypothetical protein